MTIKKAIIILTVLQGLLCCKTVFAQQAQGQVNIQAIVVQGIERIGQIFFPNQFLSMEFGQPPMIINNGEAKTGSLEIQITFQVKNAYQMQISERQDFSDAEWEPFAESKIWRLSFGDGKKTIYARFKSLSGWPSKIISGGIILDTTPPANVGNFSAASGDQKISLKWDNPPDSDFEKVRIIRSENFYPANPEDGLAVYDGRGTAFEDTGLTNATSYYYTAFSYDDIGNYASGAIVAATPQEPGVPPVPPPVIPEVPAPPEIEKLRLQDFDFIQRGEKIKIGEDSKIEIDTTQSLVISLAYEKVPEVLKTVLLSLEKDGKFFSFLLRVNRERTAYEATIVPPESGVYPFTITILDYKNQAFKKIKGQLEIIKAQTSEFQVVAYEYKKIPPFVYVLFLLLALFAAPKIYRAIKKKTRIIPL